MDEEFVTGSPLARLLAIGVRNFADDNGVFEWKPLKLKMQILPADNCDIAELLDELVQCNQISRFEVDGKPYGINRNFTKYQKPKKPNGYYPFPPEPLGNGYVIKHATTYESSEPVSMSTNHNSEPVRNQFGNSPAEGVGNREKGEGRREKEDDIPPNPIEGGSADNNQPDDQSKSPDDDDDDVDLAFEKYKVIARQCNLPVPNGLSKKRRSQLSARLKQHGIDVWYQALNKIQNSKYLRGEVNGFRATIDFMLAEPSFQKIIEGNYDDQKDVERCPL